MGIRGVGLKLTKDVNLRRVEVLVEVVEGVVVVECEQFCLCFGGVVLLVDF